MVGGFFLKVEIGIEKDEVLDELARSTRPLDGPWRESGVLPGAQDL